MSKSNTTSKGTVVAAMSGGVDSAVTAALLKQQGYEVIGITLQIWQEHSDSEAGKHGGCCSLGAVEDARRAASRIGIPHYVLNFKETFAQKVIENFVQEYARGRTPNPCVECNRSVKFDELLTQAKNLGADYLATGHYARIRFNEATGRHEMWRARDRKKDQTYALYTLTQRQLSQTLMPLGELESKEETRRIARELGLPLANKPDSQEICFVPKKGYTRFLAEKAPDTVRPGKIVDTGGRVRGDHEGIANYTIGQRRRLPASGEGPLFVIALEPATNTVVVGGNEELFADRFTASRLNWISIPALTKPVAVQARIRYNGTAESAVVEPGAGGRSEGLTDEGRRTKDGGPNAEHRTPNAAFPAAVSELGTRNSEPDTVLCRFDAPQRAITPGQAAVFYDGDVVVGGGTIEG